VRGWDHASTS